MLYEHVTKLHKKHNTYNPQVDTKLNYQSSLSLIVFLTLILL